MRKSPGRKQRREGIKGKPTLLATVSALTRGRLLEADKVKKARKGT